MGKEEVPKPTARSDVRHEKGPLIFRWWDASCGSRDSITVTCFIGLVVVYFQFTARDYRTLIQLILSGIVFAVANQLGNATGPLASILISRRATPRWCG